MSFFIDEKLAIICLTSSPRGGGHMLRLTGYRCSFLFKCKVLFSFIEVTKLILRDLDAVELTMFAKFENNRISEKSVL